MELYEGGRRRIALTLLLPDGPKVRQRSFKVILDLLGEVDEDRMRIDGPQRRVVGNIGIRDNGHIRRIRGIGSLGWAERPKGCQLGHARGGVDEMGVVVVDAREVQRRCARVLSEVLRRDDLTGLA